MGIRTHGTAQRSSGELRRNEVRRSLTVSAKLAMCLQPEFDHVSITVDDPDGGGATSWAQDGALAGALDRLQRDLGEGPSLDAARSAACIAAHDVRHDPRWLRYGRAAADLGLRSQVSAPLRWRDEVPLGSLNMYSTTDDRVGLTAPLVAQVVAAQVANALAGLHEIEALHRDLARVTQALGRTREPPSARPA